VSCPAMLASALLMKPGVQARDADNEPTAAAADAAAAVSAEGRRIRGLVGHADSNLQRPRSHFVTPTARDSDGLPQRGFEGLQRLAAESREVVDSRLGAKTKDAISLLLNVVIIVIVVLIGLFFLWGGTLSQLEADPIGELTQTAHHAEELYKKEHEQSQMQTQPASSFPARLDRQKAMCC